MKWAADVFLYQYLISEVYFDVSVMLWDNRTGWLCVKY